MLDLFASINTVSIVLFCVGLVLILIELFIPGFGIFGGLGLLSLVLCVIFMANSLEQGLLLLLIVGIIVTLIALIVARSFRKGRLYRSSLVLKDIEDSKQGYVSNENVSRFEGKTGVSLTPLRPAGMAEIDGERADVVTDGEFIDRGEKIKVLKVSGRRILVKKATE